MKLFFKIFALILIGIILISYISGYFGFGNFSNEVSTIGSYVNIEGQDIRYLEKGTGQDVLLIHGTPGSLEDMQPLFDSLSKDHHVIAYDRPGHGYSTARNIPRNLSHNISMAEAIINHFELDSTTVIGHSYGGCISMGMATSYNKRVSKYYVLGSPLFNFDCEAIYKLFDIPVLNTALSWLVSKGYAQYKISKELPTRFGPNRNMVSSEWIEERIKLWTQPKVILSKSLETVNIQNDFKELIPKYKALKNPVNIIIGEDDTPSYASDLRQHLPINKVEALFWENTGHFVQIEQLDKLLMKIRSDSKKRN